MYKWISKFVLQSQGYLLLCVQDIEIDLYIYRLIILRSISCVMLALNLISDLASWG